MLRRFFKKKTDEVAPDFGKVSRSLNALRSRFREGELRWREYILHGDGPYSLTNVGDERLKKPRE